MPFQPGQSGNPAGRPPKNRALTEILEKAGNKAIERTGESKRAARKRVLAESIWQAVTEGRVTFADGRELKIEDLQEWAGLVQFIYKHIDGPPKPGGLAGDQIPIKGYISVSPDDWDDDDGST